MPPYLILAYRNVMRHQRRAIFSVLVSGLGELTGREAAVFDLYQPVRHRHDALVVS